MSYFSDIQQGGTWKQGGTYSFLVFLSGTDNGYGSCSIGGVPGNLWSPCGGLWGDDDGTEPNHSGNILFGNTNEDLTGGVVLEDVTWEEQSGGWWKVTVTIPADLPVGNYYLKYSTYWWCQVIT